MNIETLDLKNMLTEIKKKLLVYNTLHLNKITDDAFFQSDWAGDRIATAGLDCRLWMWHSSAKTRKKKGRQELRPWPLRCLSQFLAERKDRLLRGRVFLCIFHRWSGLIFIVYVFPVGW